MDPIQDLSKLDDCVRPLQKLVGDALEVWLLAVGFFGFILGLLVYLIIQKKKFGETQKRIDQMLFDSKKEADIIRKEATIEAKDTRIRIKNKVEKELKEKQDKIDKLEKRILSKEEALDLRYNNVLKQEQGLQKKSEQISLKERDLEALQNECKYHLDKQKEALLKIASLDEKEAKKIVLDKVSEELTLEKSKMVRKYENDIKLISEKKARNVIVLAIQRQALEQCQEHSTKIVPIPNDEMKGRIIGREGRNIRAFENTCGVDLIVDDTPDAILISCFDPVRRQIAKVALEKLMADGRIHPARIEEVVKKARKEVASLIREAAEGAIIELGISNVHPEIMKLLGQLQFRTSYGQQQLKHSIEVAQLCGVMASELRMNVKLAKRAGLLHDVGKALTHEIEGSHAMIGADVCRKYGESAEVEHAVRAHHRDVEPRTALAFLVDAADAMSGGRPGARSKTEAAYIQRLEQLEEICMSYEGVQRSYAVQAGRDVRVMVDPEKVSDDQAVLLVRDLTKRIEDEIQFPGQIKVSVIREMRAVEYAQ